QAFPQGCENHDVQIAVEFGHFIFPLPSEQRDLFTDVVLSNTQFNRRPQVAVSSYHEISAVGFLEDTRSNLNEIFGLVVPLEPSHHPNNDPVGRDTPL